VQCAEIPIAQRVDELSGLAVCYWAAWRLPFTLLAAGLGVLLFSSPEAEMRRRHSIGGAGIQLPGISKGGADRGEDGQDEPSLHKLYEALVQEERTYVIRQEGIKGAPKKVIVRVGSMGINIFSLTNSKSLKLIITYMYETTCCQLCARGIVVHLAGEEIRLTGVEGEFLLSWPRCTFACPCARACP
jgi:hypothetical protein